MESGGENGEDVFRQMKQEQHLSLVELHLILGDVSKVHALFFPPAPIDRSDLEESAKILFAILNIQDVLLSDNRPFTPRALLACSVEFGVLENAGVSIEISNVKFPSQVLQLLSTLKEPGQRDQQLQNEEDEEDEEEEEEQEDVNSLPRLQEGLKRFCKLAWEQYSPAVLKRVRESPLVRKFSEIGHRDNDVATAAAVPTATATRGVQSSFPLDEEDESQPLQQPTPAEAQSTPPPPAAAAPPSSNPVAAPALAVAVQSQGHELNPRRSTGSKRPRVRDREDERSGESPPRKRRRVRSSSARPTTESLDAGMDAMVKFDWDAVFRLYPDLSRGEIFHTLCRENPALQYFGDPPIDLGRRKKGS